MLWLLTILLALLGLAFDALALGTFAQLSSGAPLWLRSLGGLEGALGQLWGNAGLNAFTRAVILSVVGSGLLGLAAYFRPRRMAQDVRIRTSA